MRRPHPHRLADASQELTALGYGDHPPLPYGCPCCLYKAPDHCTLCDEEGYVTSERYHAWMRAHPEATRPRRPRANETPLWVALCCLAAALGLAWLMWKGGG